MPRLSEERREERRRRILTSAWSCFSRNGFHATSMDDVIAATGMSSSAVYRYFRSKDELIAAAADEGLALLRDLFARLLERRPTPSPSEVLTAMAAEARLVDRATADRASPRAPGRVTAPGRRCDGALVRDAVPVRQPPHQPPPALPAADLPGAGRHGRPVPGGPSEEM